MTKKQNDLVSNPFARLQNNSENHLTSPIQKIDRNDPVPLSFQQERLWFLNRLDEKAGNSYRMDVGFQFEGNLDINAFRRTISCLLERHDNLRTVFRPNENGTPHQVIHDKIDVSNVVNILEHENLDEQSLSARIAELLSRPFDLEKGPLFRVHVIKLASDRHALIFSGHHIILDGWSMGILAKEISRLYRQETTGTPAGLAALPIQYPDYAAWQREVLSGKPMQKELSWWKEQLSGIPDPISLPSDRPRPEVMDYNGAAVPVSISKKTADKLNRLAQDHQATLFMVLEAALASLLSRMGAGDDVVIGTAVAGRPRPEFANLCGFFANTLVLRNRIDLQNSFDCQLASVRDTVVDAFAHRLTPFRVVIDATDTTRSLRHAPVVQVVCTLQNTPDADKSFELHAGKTSPLWGAERRYNSKFELWFSLTETEKGIEGVLEYSRQLFDRSTAERLS
ncbi:condensation domain-containing protein, partial [Roseibium sp. RKSG952]|uniref:condensation domain-containing protein n=1 Tax=Roseibium sp. RKSG952 TaxID=2529384 RepID=UPI0013C54BE4